MLNKWRCIIITFTSLLFLNLLIVICTCCVCVALHSELASLGIGCRPRSCSKVLLDISKKCSQSRVFSSFPFLSLDLVRGQNNENSPPAL